MTKKKSLTVACIFVLSILVIVFAYRHWHGSESFSAREQVLSLMPVEASAVLYLDVAELRASPFLAELFQWTPKVTLDNDYAQFVQATGFNYEADLDRVALAMNRQGQNVTAFAVAEGRFNRKKIEEFAGKYGSLRTADGKTLFAVPLNGTTRKAYFTFLKDDRIAWANDSNYFFQHGRAVGREEWREHYARVAGTPMFAVLRQDSDAAAALAQAPGGLRSPQLAALLAQLQWISLSAKPEGNLLRVGMEGECLTENTEHELKELLSGLVVLAQMGLNDPKTRKQLDPGLREGCLELLQSVEIQQVDRGASKTVRVVFDVTPKVLEAARSSASAADPAERNGGTRTRNRTKK